MNKCGTSPAVILIATLTLLMTTTNVRPEAHIKTHQVTDKILILECVDQGSANVTVYKGEKGLLVVDAGYWGTREKLAEAMANVGNGKVHTLILTHGHGDHAGGNRPISAGVTIVAHENAANRLELDFGFMGEESPIAMPTVSVTDTMTIDFEGEKIHLVHYPRAHTDGDIIVHFANSGVVCTGDLSFSEKLPFVHISRGGTFTGLLKSLTTIMDTYGDDVTYVPGHGKTMNREELAAWSNEVVRMVEIVGKGVDDGMGVDELVAADVLKEWDALSDPVYTTKEFLIQLIYQDKVYAGNPPKPIGDVIRAVVLEKGIEAGIKMYRDLWANDREQYDFNVGELNTLGYNLMARGMLDEAVAIFQLNVEYYPEHFATYDSMGEAFMNRGDTALAIQNYEKSLELNPDNENAEVMLGKLR